MSKGSRTRLDLGRKKEMNRATGMAVGQRAPRDICVETGLLLLGDAVATAGTHRFHCHEQQLLLLTRWLVAAGSALSNLWI